VVEDGFARLLGHGGPLPPPLVADDRDGTVVRLTSLTKPAAPRPRIEALVARGPVMQRLQAVRRWTTSSSPARRRRRRWS
jgi:DNA-binding transcriptional MocR family regulator